MDVSFGVGRLDEEAIKGFRYKDSTYAFYDIFYHVVSGHYLIQERFRFRQHRQDSPPKPIMGPYPLEILEPEAGADAASSRCFEIIRKKIDRRLSLRVTA